MRAAALERVGIRTDTPDPTDGVIEHDSATGEPTGLLLEMDSHLDGRVHPLSEDAVGRKSEREKRSHRPNGGGAPVGYVGTPARGKTRQTPHEPDGTLQSEGDRADTDEPCRDHVNRGMFRQRAKLNGSLFSLTLVQIERKTFSHSMFRAKSNSSRMRSQTCPTKPRMNTLAKSDKLSDLR